MLADDASSGPGPPPRALRSRSRPPLVGLALAVAWVTAVTLLLYPLSQLDPGVSSGTLYILGVLLLATQWGLWLGLATSLASALALYYFHSEPTETLASRDLGDVVAIGVLLLTASIGSVIADRARLRAADAEDRARLEAELRERQVHDVRLGEVQASRARVLAAADAERRRLVRDLHDGAQQRLVHTVVTLKLAERARGDEARHAKLLDEALDHAQMAMVELRELAHGILPAALNRGGLAAGVDALATRMPIPVEQDTTPIRFAADVEATAYFVVSEALTNVAKHARAERTWVRARVDDGELRIEVRDDGVGGAWSGGNGLLGLQDRLAAVGGRLRMESEPGRGTLVAAEIPLSDGRAQARDART